MNWRELPLFRCGFSLLLLAQAWNTAGKAVAGGGMANLGPAFGTVICLLIAGIILSSVLRPWLTLPATHLVDLLYFGDTSEGRPPQTLRLAHAYLSAGRWEEAQMECERQLEWHRESPELWACLVHAGQGAEDARELERILKRARLRLRSNAEALEKFEALTKAGPPRIPTGKSFLWQS